MNEKLFKDFMNEIISESMKIFFFQVGRKSICEIQNIFEIDA